MADTMLTSEEFGRATGVIPERSILLVDLFNTLVEPTTHDRSMPYHHHIRTAERYRGWVADLVRGLVERHACVAVLTTARSQSYRRVTLEAMTEVLGDRVDGVFARAVFSQKVEGAKAHHLKRDNFQRSIEPLYGPAPGSYFAIESNHQTRGVYAGWGIPAQDVFALVGRVRDARAPISRTTRAPEPATQLGFL